MDMSFKSFQKINLAAMIFLDFVVLLFSLLFSYYLSIRWNPYSYLPLKPYFKAAVVVSLLWMLLFAFYRLYSTRVWQSYLSEARGIINAVSVGLILIFAIGFLYRGFSFSRRVFLLTWIVAIILLLIIRGLLRLTRRYLVFKRGIANRGVAIIGLNPATLGIARRFTTDESLGKRVLTILSSIGDSKGNGGSEEIISRLNEMRGIKLTGLEQLPAVASSENVDEIIVTDRSELTPDAFFHLVQDCRREGVALKMVPEMMDVAISQLTFDSIEGLPLMELGNALSTFYAQVVKRTSDVIFGVIAIIITSPILLLSALLRKLTSPGPIRFTHRRLGKGQYPIKVYKFRTMYIDGDRILKEKGLWAEFQKNFKLKHDPRITPVGRFIRKLSIDELPQLLNVLKGDMSLVGPRPIVEGEIPKYGPWEASLFSITPGMTGLWQVSGRSDLGYDERVKLDIYYIENWSLWLDVKIIFQTIPALLFSRGSY
jgi:exopolysaccharide biosynthesis polyprenyl glycosylphosphotransferase